MGDGRSSDETYARSRRANGLAWVTALDRRRNVRSRVAGRPSRLAWVEVSGPAMRGCLREASTIACMGGMGRDQPHARTPVVAARSQRLCPLQIARGRASSVGPDRRPITDHARRRHGVACRRIRVGNGWSARVAERMHRKPSTANRGDGFGGTGAAPRWPGGA